MEPRTARGIEAVMVDPACVAHAQRVHAQIAERLHPLLENGGGGSILLQKDATDFSRSIVHIEIDRHLGLFGRLDRDRAGVTTSNGRLPLSVRIFRFRARPEVVGNIPLRTEKALLLAAP